MTFLQPFILWGLPLILLPVLIHLFNRLRHRSVPWAAMMFLRSATRKSTRYARLRQFLVLLFRVLAVLVLVLALSRPLSGGWMGWMVSSAPDVIVILLDRSASMETRDTPGAQNTKREDAVKLLAETAHGFEKTSRVILIENVGRDPQELPGAALTEVPNTSATDTAADIPAMVQSALDWFSQNKPGSAELWIASDFQRSNWDPESERWGGLATALATFPQGIRVRLLGLNREFEANSSIALGSAHQRRQNGQFELDLAFDIERSGPAAATLPVTLVVNGASSTIDVRMEGQSLRYRHRVPLGVEGSAGWGYVELPADVNTADNRSYFVYGAPPQLRAALVALDERSIPFLQFATAPDAKSTNQICEVIAESSLDEVNWANYSLVLWQRPLPQGTVAKALETYASDGGVVVFFPPGEAGSFAGLGWGETQTTPDNQPYEVSQWDQKDGPLANTDEGLALPLDELAVRRRQGVAGDQTILASFKDGQPFLTRRSVGRGQILFCTTLPNAEWSALGDGSVLVPMLHRLFLVGSQRLYDGLAMRAGETTTGQNWVSVDSAQPKDFLTQSGVYRSGTRLVAVNRPAEEDDQQRVEPSRIKALFGGATVRLFEERGKGQADLQSELWRLFLFCMIAFLVVEGALILPERRPRGEDPISSPPPGAMRGRNVGAAPGVLSEVSK